MIDWFVILFVAIAMLIFHMQEIAGHDTTAGYLQIPGKNQVSTGTVSMLFRFLSGTFLFISLFVTVSYGYLSGLVLTVAGIVVLLWFRRRIIWLTEEYSSYENLRHFLKRKTKGWGRAPLYLLLLLAGSEGLVISSLLTNKFMRLAFGIHPVWTSSILFFFVFVFAGMGGAGGLYKIGRPLLFIFFLGMTVLPIGTVLTQGATIMHEQYRNLPVNNWHKESLLLTALLFMIFMAGHFLVYFLLSEDLLSVKRARLKITIGLTAICWSSMPVAVSVMGVYFLTRSGETEIPALVSQLANSLSYPLLYILVYTVLSCLTLSMGVSLHSFMRLVMPLLKGRKAINKGYAVSFGVCILVYLVTFMLDIQTVILFYVHLFISLSFPLWLMLRYRVQWGWDLSFVIFGSMAIGLWVSQITGVLNGLCANAGILGTVLFFLLIRKIRTIQK